MTVQLTFDLHAPRRWGGRRARAGRKPAGERAGMPYVRRPTFVERHPAHVTLRMRPGVPSLRTARLVQAFERSMARGCERGDFRLVHYSLQSNHVHMLVEASDRGALARGTIAVGSRLARAVNRVFKRIGRVLADRYHVRALKTPREVRNALRYVLLNARRHARRLSGAMLLDPASSARWFDGWRQKSHYIDEWRGHSAARPVARARTWLLGKGWQRHGLLDPADVPGTS